LNCPAGNCDNHGRNQNYDTFGRRVKHVRCGATPIDETLLAFTYTHLIILNVDKESQLLQKACLCATHAALCHRHVHTFGARHFWASVG
jgi:hypothetical protein